MSIKLELAYDISLRSRLQKNITKKILCDIKFVHLLFREYNDLEDITFDIFLDTLYTKGEAYIIGNLNQIRVEALLLELESEEEEW
jgi:hypothetical protein|tara:strand:- start:457 stop:714 length:258 start_codon:yes stop_codon:yes gene_type:complete